MKPVLICRPRGGLNDFLCQIQHCLAYCRKHGRVLVLDTRYSGLKDDFFRYFTIQGTRVPVMAWAAFQDSADLSGASVHPAAMAGRLDGYDATHGPNGAFVDTQTGTVLGLDFSRSYPEDIVLHDACGGGINSYWLLKYLQPTPFLKQQVERRIAGLPARYRAVHIRNTDLKTDHVALLRALDFAISGRDVLFCTDSGTLQAALKAGQGHTARAHFLTELNPVSDDPLHGSALTTIDSNLDMFADLIALARAQRLYFSFTQEGRISGFSGLAYAVHCSRLSRQFSVQPSSTSPTRQAHRGWRGLGRFLKDQWVILLAKAIYCSAIKLHEAWPNR